MSTVSRPLNSGINEGGVILWPTSILVQCPTGGTGMLCLRHAFARAAAESPNSFATAAIGVAGLMAGSVALLGFGVDSAIESCLGAVLLWRWRSEQARKEIEKAERTAPKLLRL